MPALTSFTSPLTLAQAEQLRARLPDLGFDFIAKPYTLFAAEKPAAKVNVSVYEKGPKVLIQGKGTEDFVKFCLEPEILGAAQLGYEEELNPEAYAPHFGIDESGKGDFFGPLVIAGVYVDPEIARAFQAAGVTDSKKIGSEPASGHWPTSSETRRAPCTTSSSSARKPTTGSTQRWVISTACSAGATRA